MPLDYCVHVYSCVVRTLMLMLMLILVLMLMFVLMLVLQRCFGLLQALVRTPEYKAWAAQQANRNR